jgi:hypothetical protein
VTPVAAACPRRFANINQEEFMPALNQHFMSQRGFRLWCMTTVAAGGWLTPRQAFAEARNIVP